MHTHHDDVPSDAERPEGPSYEAPAVVWLGTIGEMTQGIVPITNDGLGPGSAL